MVSTVWQRAAELNTIARSFHDFGGPIHIVWDDLNVDDGFIRWCLDNMDGHYADWHDDCDAPTERVCRVVMEDLATLFLEVPEGERERYLGILRNADDTKDGLARELAEIEDPTTHSTEGLDDGCFFCGAWSQSVYVQGDVYSDFEHFAEHDVHCLWVRARRAFGLGLGRNTVKAEEA